MIVIIIFLYALDLTLMHTIFTIFCVYYRLILDNLLLQDKNAQVNWELWREVEAYGDIQLMPFVDYYSLITLKTIAICIYGVSVYLKQPRLSLVLLFETIRMGLLPSLHKLSEIYQFSF